VILSEMKTALKRFGYDDSDPLTTWLNAAMHEFEDEFRWTFTELITTGTLTSGSLTLTVPSTYVRTIALTFTSPAMEDPLVYITYRDYQQRRADDGGAIPGVPMYWTKGPGGLIIHPVPDADRGYEHIFRARAADMAVDDDSPAFIPLEYHYALVEGAAAIALAVDNSEERVADHRSIFEAAMARAAGKYLSRTEGNRDQVRDIQDYGTTS
jgi:hypothetical protein